MADRIVVTCTCCESELTVDVESGEVLAEKRAKPDTSRSFEDALNQVRSGSQRREQAFSKAFDRTQRLDTLLDRKFEEAKKKASENPASKPTNPFDLD